ncbi:rho guanine nucleotide exchange factor TIAM2 [Conger conger]|uniref:rho guanine nucleotide exchange factor TIAM2 n=1 Tax=Conger conger TaxID=82655 RepID=UPI002A59F603|nr:rho guanine nucleotide exchange factor TIAM2 [Conger conger]
MGNSDSLYSIPGPKGNGLIFPRKQKSCSLRFRSAKEEALSPHSWWRSREVGAGYKSRAAGRGCLSQNKPCQPYASHHYDYVSNGGKATANSRQWTSCTQENGYHYGYNQLTQGSCYKAAGNGHAVNGYGPLERTQGSVWEPMEDKSSPKVLLSEDGSLRVEFTNTSSKPALDSLCGWGGSEGSEESGGPVQLLKYSPTLEITTAPGRPEAPTDSTLRTSQGSSLSSDCSWYDSPWGNGAELSDADNTCSSGQTTDHSGTVDARCPGQPEDHSNVANTRSCACSEEPNTGNSVVLQEELSGFHKCLTMPVSSSDLHRDSRKGSTFPASKSSHTLGVMYGLQRTSVASIPDEPLEEDCHGARRYSSYTLPCRKARPVVESNSRKDALKSRIRRISDWTGSLSRKRRKLQEPRGSEAGDCLDSGVDGLTADTVSQVSSLLWHPAGPAPAPPARRRSSNGPLGSYGNGDALRQNIYESFMRELETGRGAEERPEPSEGTAESSAESRGSLEQLDLLLEKEQGVVRRAGWLSFKPLLTLSKDRKLELVTRRKWKQYWITLKGCTLLFYETYGKNSPEQELSPCYALFAEDSVVQAVPEHPKKENVFCLSNAYGDVYLFQASSQPDLENWVTALHSASASLFAKRHGKEDTVRLLRSQTQGLLQKIDMDGKMKKMAELQLCVVSDHKNRKAIESQIQQWEQNLEKFNVDLFRLRCYLSSLQGGELPNPKSLLAAASRPSKMALGRLGIFSVSSFHALICSRDEATLRRRSRSVSQGVRSKRRLFSSLKGLDSLTRRGREKRQPASQIFEGSGGGQLSHLPPNSSERLDGLVNQCPTAPPEGSHWDISLETQTCVLMPDQQVLSVAVKQEHCIEDVLSLACKLKQLDPSQHCVRLRRRAGPNTEVSTPAPKDLVQELSYDELEVLPLNVYTLCMSRQDGTTDFGFAVTGHVDGFGNSRVFVSEVLPEGLAFAEGLRAGDEILVLNGKGVSTLDLGLMQGLFSEQMLNLTLRREDTAPGDQGSDPGDPCPPAPPPSQSQLLEEFLDQHGSKHTPADMSRVTDVSSGSVGPCSVDGLVNSQASVGKDHNKKTVETGCTLYQTFQESPAEVQRDPPDPPRPCPRHMSVTERLRKVIQELVDTEKSYVKDLSCLFEVYLKPLQEEPFLSLDEMESLFGSLPEMLDFQRVFLQTLEERIASSPDFSTLETPGQFKKLLFSLGGSFLYYADHFKLYSGFCANHIKVQKVLERAKTDRAFKEFLEAKNPTKQHSSTLESYLIKPVQRVLKYPLLLRELVSLTDSDSEEHYHLTEALKAMEKVASHINEMQKIYEDYGTVFDQLVAEQSGPEKEVTEISMGEFLLHASVVWLNPFPSLGRMRKDPELTVFVFKKAVILVYRESNKLKKKMATTRSAFSNGDLDPFKFRWLIPQSALQVRLGNATGTEGNCMWELIHTKSELEGRPETVFQLMSSAPESKANIVRVIRGLLRDSARKNMTADKACRERFAPPRGAVPTSARIGSSRSSWLSKRSSPPTPAHTDTAKGGRRDSDEGSLGSGGHPGDDPGGPRHSPSLKEADREEADAIEALLQRLHIAEKEPPPAQTQAETQPEPDRRGSSPSGGQEDSPYGDLNALLERDFSVQSLASVINEDCFFSTAESMERTTVPTL